MAKKPTVRFTPEPEEYTPIPHYHVMTNDVGFIPDVENIGTHLTLEGAEADMLEQVENHLEALSQIEDPETRGGTLVVDEIESVTQQLNDYRTTVDRDSVATYGYWFGIDGGIAVIELGLCVDNCELPDE